MKKLIGVLGVVAIAMTMFFSTDSLNKSYDNIDLASLTNINEAHAEFDPIASCNSWCTSGSVCVLVTNAGFNINCYGWAQP